MAISRVFTGREPLEFGSDSVRHAILGLRKRRNFAYHVEMYDVPCKANPLWVFLSIIKARKAQPFG